MRSTAWIFPLVALTAAAWIAAATLGSSPDAVPEAVGPGPASVTSSILKFEGAGSCAARACHGNPNPRSDQKWNGAYAIWARSDPHARAFDVLYTPESIRIASVLEPTNRDPKPWQNARCLACHSLPVAAEDVAAAEKSGLLADGVSCEACHGPAKSWIGVHFLQGWNRQNLGDRRFAAPYHMFNTEAALPRAKMCVGCHVGEPAEGDRPVRDVNHDLIAAGHPRLNFEYSAYMARLPRHWGDKSQTDEASQFDEALQWKLGQWVSADAALKLLESRAEAVLKQSTPRTELPAPHATAPAAWPELAEYDCFSCHHGLQADNWRSKAAAINLQAGPTDSRPLPRPGVPTWGSWYFDGPRWLGASDQKFITSLNDVTAAMQTPLPDANDVLQRASACRRSLAALQENMTPADAAPDQLLAMLRRHYETRKPANWDDAVQLYLALVALNNSQRQASPTAATDAAAKERMNQTIGMLMAIRNRLSFAATINADGPPTAEQGDRRDPAFQASLNVLRILRPGVNSPEKFDPFMKPRDASPTDPRFQNDPFQEQNLYDLFQGVFSLLAS